jgi:hypothetical protein
MRFVANDHRDVEVTWYWCDVGAQPGPYTVFASGNWSEDKNTPWPGPGEVKGAPRVWYDGKNLWGQSGTHRCGTDEQFRVGLDHYPTDAEWCWCCCPWNSRVRLAVQPPRAAAVLTPAGYGSSAPAAAGQVAARQRYSLPRLCVSPSSAAVLTPTGYGSSAPAADQVVAPARSSLSCLCLSPTSGQPVPVFTAYGSSAAAGTADGIMRGPTRFSLACLCVSAKTLALLPTTTKPYGSSAPAGSVPAGAAPWVSLTCLCVRPSTSAELLPTELPYGSSVGPRGSAELPRSPWLSLACLCLQPAAIAAAIAGAGSGQTGSAAPPAAPLVSSACLCLSPRSSTALPPVGPYDSGGGSTTSSSSGGGGGGVTNQCGSDLPLTLYATVTPLTGCSSMVTSYTLRYDPLTQIWTSGLVGCNETGTTITVSLGCVDGVWSLTGWDAGGGPTPIPCTSSTTSPLAIAWAALGVVECCVGTVQLVITA